MDYAQMPHGLDPNMAPMPREEVAHRLVRLDTEIRQQLADEGWEGSHPDGFLTEEELLNAARAQGVLKKKIRNWRTIALLSVARLLLSCACILSMVIFVNKLLKEQHVNDRGFLYAQGTRNLVQTAPAAYTYDILDWASANPVSILNMDRVVLQMGNGTMLAMTVAAADADFGTIVLTIQTASAGYLVIANQKIVKMNLEISQLPNAALTTSLTGQAYLAGTIDTSGINGQTAIARNPGNSVLSRKGTASAASLRSVDPARDILWRPVTMNTK